MKQLTIYSQRSVPIVAVNTPDQVALSQLIAANPPDSGMKVVTYDTLRGYSRIPEDLPPELSGMAAGKFANNAHAALNAARHFGENTIVVMHNMHGLLMSPSAQHGIIQGLHNLRDEFKRNRRMIVMLGSHFILPDAIRNDVVIIDDNIPTRDECKELVKKVMAMTGQEHEPLPEEIDAIHGLPEFQAEQALSIALKLKDGKAVYDVQEAWKLKQQLIGMTSGLSVWNRNDTFADVGGLDGVKTYLTRLFDGPEPPQVIVWLDEIEKSAIASAGDANGINSDMLGTMLSYMEDHNVLGACLVGVPGAGKSALVKATGGQFNRLVIRLDLSAMKGSFVGESLHPEEEIYVFRNMSGGGCRRFTMEQFHKVWESGDKDWYTWTMEDCGGFSYKKVMDSFKHHRTQRFVEITTRTGRKVIVTENHSVFKKRKMESLVAGGVAIASEGSGASEYMKRIARYKDEPIFVDASAGDLVAGDRIAILRKTTKDNKRNPKVTIGNVTVEMTVALCEYIGLWLADGSWCSGEARVSLGPDDSEVIEKVNALFGNKITTYRNKVSRGVDLIGNRGNWVSSVMKLLGVNGTSKTKRIPEWVFGLPTDLMAAIARGYFSGDGSFSGHVIESSTASKLLAKDMACLLSSIGVFCRLRNKSFKAKDQVINGVKSSLASGVHTRISISKMSELRKFKDSIGFIQGYKQNSLLEFLGGDEDRSYSEGRVFNSVFWDDVVSIDFIDGPEHCYDISVDKTEKFIAGGVLVHNSEQNLRSALRLISAIGGDRCLFLATSNSTDKLDVALQSRFSDTFWFGLPTEAELAPVWDIQKKRFNVPDYKHPADQYGWVGRNIKQCCEKSYRMTLTLEEAAQSVIPVGVSAKDDIDKLLKAASGRYLDAGTGKVVE